jgi:hypothetical protein
MRHLSSKLPFLAFFLLLLAVFFPLFHKGFIFSYDGLFFYPKIVYKLHYLLPNQTYFLFLLNKLSYLIPTWLIQRLIWLSALYIGALGCFYLFKRIHKLAGYLAGIFFIFNPFIYERMIMGQVMIILGFSLYPWVILLLKKYFRKKKIIFFLFASILAGVATLFFTHSLFILNLIVLVIFLHESMKNKNYRKLAIHFIIYLIIIIVMNLNWFLPSVSKSSSLAELSTQFEQSDFSFYATSSGKINNIWLNILTLNGHWAERENFFNYHLNSPVSMIASIIILGLVMAGTWLGVKDKKKRLAGGLAVLFGAVACVLAIGKAHFITAILVDPLYRYLPFYKGMREPEKWVVVLVLVYVYFLALFLNFSFKRFRKRKFIQWLIIVCLMVLPIVNTHQMLWGFNKQLKVGDFPKSWYEVNQFLAQQKNDFKVLFLPWHFYIDLSFAGRKIINPALGFFDKFTFIGSDIEVNNTYYQIYNEELEVLEDQIELIKNNSCPDPMDFKEIRIKYIILAKEDDWQSYTGIKKCDNIRLIRDYQDLSLLQLL